MSTSEKTPSSLARKFFVAGVDLGQKQDHSAVAIVEKRDKEFDLLLLNQFELGIEYGSVHGYLKLLNENLHANYNEHAAPKTHLLELAWCPQKKTE